MRQVEILRIEETQEGSMGILRLDGVAFCVTLEPPYRNNERRVSCIPTGSYVCRRHESPRFGETFMVFGVSGRDNILFHAGNVVDDTMGCILLAQYFGKLHGDRAILNSGSTFRSFMKMLGGVDEFNLNIKRVL